MLKLYVVAQETLRRAIREDRGATAVEYGLIIALIAAVIIGIVALLGHKVSSAFNYVYGKM